MKVRAYQVLLEVTRSLSQCGPLDIYELGCEYMDDIGISLRMMFTVIKKIRTIFQSYFIFSPYNTVAIDMVFQLFVVVKLSIAILADLLLGKKKKQRFVHKHSQISYRIDIVTYFEQDNMK